VVSVLVLVGRIASGKTSVARLIAERLLNVQVVTVSSVLVQLADERGVDTSSRSALQGFGLDMIERRPEVLTRAIKEQVRSGELLILDGLRSVAVLKLLRSSSDIELRCVYLDVSTMVRKARYDRRRTSDSMTFEAVDGHPVEAQVDAMRAFADEEVDASRPLEEVTSRVMASLAGDLQD
jgi:dephospho-CoA kinase